MAITVGTDTYISVTDATTYVAENYLTTDTIYTTWASLSSTQKEIYLRRATKKIDRQPLVGVKSVSTQTLQFPRAILTQYAREDVPLLNIWLDTDWVVETTVSQKVKDAQVEEAVAMAITPPKRLDLQRQGVKSFSLGNLSESYTVNYNDFYSYEAKQLLRYYLAGSVRIC